MLDIHQIATGRGNAAFFQFPDGTTMLVDAGDAGETAYAEQRPDSSRTPGQWIARYVRQMMPKGRPPELDYAVLTHFHPDHMGRITGQEPLSKLGDYRLRGITEVADDIPVRRLVDRGWPDYTYLPPARNDAMFANYRRFVAAATAAKRTEMIGAQAGSTTQIVAARKQDPVPAPFEVRIVSVNDRVWTGEGNATKVRFPVLAEIAVPEDRPTENMCSIERRAVVGHEFIEAHSGRRYAEPLCVAVVVEGVDVDRERVVAVPAVAVQRIDADAGGIGVVEPASRIEILVVVGDADLGALCRGAAEHRCIHREGQRRYLLPCGLVRHAVECDWRGEAGQRYDPFLCKGGQGRGDKQRAGEDTGAGETHAARLDAPFQRRLGSFGHS